MLSGGSSVSWSVTWVATTVTVHNSLDAKSASGSRVNVVGPPLTAALWVPLAHEIVNQLPVAFTGSLKLSVMLALRAIPTAPFAGVVLETVGAWSALLRGSGEPTSKSVGLSLVSCAPPLLRSAAVVLLRFVVG